MQMTAPWCALTAEDERAELLIHGVIVDEAGFFGGVGARDLVEALAEVDGLDLTVRINSPGGDAFGGVAVMNALRLREGHTVARVEGLAASAASIIAMGADRIEMADGAMLMIHDAAGATWGPARDHMRTSDLLEKLSNEMAQVYARRCHKNPALLRELMIAETWFTAEEAVEFGLADTALAESRPLMPANVEAVRASLSAYRKTPFNALRVAACMDRVTNTNGPSAGHETEGNDMAEATVDTVSAEAHTDLLALYDESQQLVARLQAEVEQFTAEADELRNRAEAAEALVEEINEAQRVKDRDAYLLAQFQRGAILESQIPHFADLYDVDADTCRAALQLIEDGTAIPVGEAVAEFASAANPARSIESRDDIHREAQRRKAAQNVDYFTALRQVCSENPEAAAAAGLRL